jgi:hypothetical protein
MTKLLIAAALLCGLSSANAATAYLEHCEYDVSVTGRGIYVGTYNYAGKRFQRAFTSWCPSSVEVY